MLGLGGYASSDEEEDDGFDTQNAKVKPTAGVAEKDEKPLQASVLPVSISPSVGTHDVAPVLGPAAGPGMPPEYDTGLVYDDEPTQELSYEDSRAAIRNMTMPPLANFSIPPSPPGSPPPASTKKFTHFLKIKKQGVHFNERLQNTTALRNPTLFQKLREHAGISEEEQYATTLPDDLAVPLNFPPWAYADELNKSQAKIRQKKEQKPRETIDFVSAVGSSASSRVGTPKGGGKSTAERVLGGLNEERTRSPQLHGRKR